MVIGLGEMLEIPEARGAIVVLVGWLIAIPAGLLHKLLDEAPDWAIPPQGTTAMAAGILTILGYIAAGLLGLPREYGLIIGAISGSTSGTAAKVMGSKPTMNPPASPGGE